MSMPSNSGHHLGGERQALGRRGFLAGVSALGIAGISGSQLLSGGRGAAAAGVRTPAVAAPLGPVPAADLDPLDLLQRMLSFDTQNFGTGGKTRPYAEMLKGVWDSAGVSCEIIPTPKKDNVHLLARIKGTTSAEPLLVLGHSDVVPAEEENWDTDPFTPTVAKGAIYGRGALDMKGMNSASISGLLRHIDEGGLFERDIIVLTDCDEEAGDFGSGWLAEKHWGKLKAGMVLTEGGWFLAQPDKTTPMLITVTRQDKVYFNLDLTASGTATHSSKPNPDSAIVSLARAIDRLAGYLAPVQLTPVTRRYFRALGGATQDRRLARAIEMMLGAKTSTVRERAARVVVARSSYPWLHSALLRTTSSFVIEDAGYKENVIPSTATVRVNCRGIPGGQKPQAFIAHVRRMMKGTDVEVALGLPPGTSEEEYLQDLDTSWATKPATLDTPLYMALESAAQQTYPDATFAPALFEAGTSLTPWREHDIPGYGVYPYVIDNAQLVAMHGNNENIYVDALRQGTDFMYRMFDHFRV